MAPTPNTEYFFILTLHLDTGVFHTLYGVVHNADRCNRQGMFYKVLEKAAEDGYSGPVMFFSAEPNW